MMGSQSSFIIADIFEKRNIEAVELKFKKTLPN